MKHQHQYDANGKQTCCTLEEKINKKPSIILMMTDTTTTIQAKKNLRFKCSYQQS